MILVTHYNSCCHAIKVYQSKSGFSSFCFLPRNYSQMFSIYLFISLMRILLSLTAKNVSCLSQFCCCTSIGCGALPTIIAPSGGLSPEPVILLPVPVPAWALHLKCEHFFLFRKAFFFPLMCFTYVSVNGLLSLLHLKGGKGKKGETCSQLLKTRVKV